MKTFHLTIARVGEHVFDGPVVSASFPGAEGTFEILAEHEAFVSLLRDGQVRITTESGEVRHVAVSEGGVAEVSHNQATILL